MKNIVIERLREHVEKYLDKSNVACRLQAEYDKNGQIKTLQSEINNINIKFSKIRKYKKNCILTS